MVFQIFLIAVLVAVLFGLALNQFVEVIDQRAVCPQNIWDKNRHLLRDTFPTRNHYTSTASACKFCRRLACNVRFLISARFARTSFALPV